MWRGRVSPLRPRAAGGGGRSVEPAREAADRAGRDAACAGRSGGWSGSRSCRSRGAGRRPGVAAGDAHRRPARRARGARRIRRAGEFLDIMSGECLSWPVRDNRADSVHAMSGRPANVRAGETGGRRSAGSVALDARTLRRHRLNSSKHRGRLRSLSNDAGRQTPASTRLVDPALTAQAANRRPGPSSGHVRRDDRRHLVGSAAVTEPASSIPSAEDRPGLARGRYVPALLTILVPGLGHLVAGRLRLAALFGLPLVFLAALAAGLLVATTADQLVGALLDDRCPRPRARPRGRPARLAAPGARLVAHRPAAARGCACATRCRSSRSSSWWPRPQAYAGVVSQAVRESANDVFVEDAASSGAWQPAATPTSTRPRASPRAPRRAVADALAVADRDAGGGPDQRADPGRGRGRRAQHVPDRHDDRGVAGPRGADGLAPLLPPRPGGRPPARRRRLLGQGQLTALRMRAGTPARSPARAAMATTS